MPVYRNVTAAIYVDGVALDEYQVDYDDSQKLVSCWIPSQVGKEFSIQVRNTTLNDHMEFTVNMDGSYTNKRRVAPQAVQIVNQCRPSPTTYRSFVFSQGQPVDDDEVYINPTHMAGIGTIAIKVFKGKLGSQLKIGMSCSRDIRIPETRKIPERAKKGIDTCIVLGPIKTRGPQEKRKGREFEPTELQAKFIFKYRPLGFLQAQCIAPPPPATSLDDGRRANNARKRKRSIDEVKPEAGPSKATHTDNQTGAMRDVLGVEINTEEGLEMLRALRSKIDQVLAEKDPEIRPKKERKPAVVAKSEIIDLT